MQKKLIKTFTLFLSPFLNSKFFDDDCDETKTLIYENAEIQKFGNAEMRKLLSQFFLRGRSFFQD